MSADNVRRIFISSFRLYFAPLVGAYRQVKIELERIEQERHQH